MKRKKTGALAAALIMAAAGALIIFLFQSRSRNPIPLLEKGKRPAWAEARLKEMATKNPDDLEVQKWLIQLALEKDELEQAQKRVDFLLLKHPEEYVSLSGSCKVAVKKKEWQRAKAACARALELSDRSLSDLLLAASAFLKAGEPEAAYPLLKEAEAQDKNNPAVINNLGYYHLLRREYDQAIACFQKVLEKNPRDETARLNLARAYHETGRHREAVAELKRVLEHNPGQPDALFNITLIYLLDLKDLDTAVKYFKLAMKSGLDPERAQKLAGLVWEAGERRKRQKAAAKSGSSEGGAADKR